MGVLRWWGGALTVREAEGRGVRGGCSREGREFSLSEEEEGSSGSLSSLSLKFMGMRRVGLEVVDCARGVVVVMVFWGESWASGVVELVLLLLRFGVWVE
jgi:hypothetical protein